jgi:large subunit ribosomal protein L35
LRLAASIDSVQGLKTNQAQLKGSSKMAGCKKSRGPNNPKMKSNRAALKRFTVTGTGLIKYPSKGKSHCLSNKSRKRKRQLLKAGYLNKGDAARCERSIPYLF